MKEKRISRARYNRFFCILGVVLLVLGAALELAQSASFLAPVKEALNLRRNGLHHAYQ